nr:Abi family protein [Cellulomonas palmilytica]
MMVEELTIGQLSTVYRNLARRSDRTAVAAVLGLTAPVLESWLQTYVRVRNVCAHHGRLWNVGLGVYPVIPASDRISWLDGPLPERSRQRLYPVLVSLQAVLDTVSPRSRWAVRLHDLVAPRPAMNLAGMGVPSGWSDDPFWRRHLA